MNATKKVAFTQLRLPHPQGHEKAQLARVPYRTTPDSGLNDFEKTEGPKVEQRPGTKPPKVDRPRWEIGYTWAYQLGGVKTGTLVQGYLTDDVVNGLNARVVKAGGDAFLLTDKLETIQIQEGGAVKATYTPPSQDYEWPLEVGNWWQYWGSAEARAGKMDVFNKITIYKRVDVKGYGIVRVPAGEFEAFYLLATSQLGARISEIWYAPKVRYYVKLVNYTNEGRVTAELVSYSLTPKGSAPASGPSQAITPSPPISAPTPSPPPAARESLATPTPPPIPAPPVGHWLGVPLGPVDQQTRDQLHIPLGQGAVVLQFARDPNLPPVDLDPGDVILAIDGVDVEGPGHVAALLAGKGPGSTIRVRVFHRQNGQQVEQPMVVLQGKP